MGTKWTDFMKQIEDELRAYYRHVRESDLPGLAKKRIRKKDNNEQ